jgi:hypothetical protein
MMKLRTARGPIAEVSAIVVDLHASENIPAARRARRLLAFTGLGVAAYLLALAATVPARLVLPLPDASGTIWRGTAPLAGGNELTWRWAPLRTLTGFGFATDWTIKGQSSDLAGRLLLRPGAVVLDAVSGSADGALLRVAAPDLPFTCTFALQVNLPRAALGGADQGIEGDVRSDAGTCQAFGAAGPTPVPPMILAAAQVGRDTEITLAPLGQRRRILMNATLTPEGRLSLRVTPEGARILPFATPPGGMAMETEL